MNRYTLHNANNLGVLRSMPDNSVDSIVTDPPYGLSFMGKKWDYDVPSVELWAECLRVLKPGGHLLAFAGTRTQHRMAVRIEDAGFEIRDMIAWVYGCLSEDTEILTRDGWKLYHESTRRDTVVGKEILVYDPEADLYQWEKPERWSEYRVQQDTAYRIQSDRTDQIVSRGHRCLVERSGSLVFERADELSDLETVPTLPDDFLGLQEGQGDVLQQAVQRGLPGAGVEKVGAGWRCGIQPAPRKEGDQGGEEPGVERWGYLHEPQRELRQSGDQVRQVPADGGGDGPEGRVCDGAQASCRVGGWSPPDPDGVRPPHKPRCDGQPAGEPDVVCDERGSQGFRGRKSYSPSLATVTAIQYTGLIFCPTVSTGAFVARRNGKVFVTGNSGFPKSLDVSKAIDKAAGAEREMRVNERWASRYPNGPGGNLSGDGRSEHYGQAKRIIDGPILTSDPATEAARQWGGWGTALKPSMEPITLARKPFDTTIAENVLMYGTGGLNIEVCRVGTEPVTINTWDNGAKPFGDGAGNPFTSRISAGRWPANTMHDGSDEVVGLFPDAGGGFGKRGGGSGGEWNPTDRETKKGQTIRGGGELVGYGDSGSAARFFYCPKASKSDRDEGCGDVEHQQRDESRKHGDPGGDNPRNRGVQQRANYHPTVKPTQLMQYLCRLVTPPNGIVLDPFMGSGSTGKAALLEGFRFIGIEKEPEYMAIAERRIAHASPEPSMPVSVNVGIEPVKQEQTDNGQLSLFGSNNQERNK